MKKLLLATLLLGSLSHTALAGEAKVSWGKLDNFSDIHPGHSENKDQFRARLMQEFADVFNGFAQKLPEGFVLQIDVSDLDLAGDIRPGIWLQGTQIRLMREIYWPKMSFTYELRNAQQEVVAKGKEELNDMDYLHRVKIPSGKTSFDYEEKMLQTWFKRQVATGQFPSKDSKAIAGNP
ncbi:DUF3016 domain-containing protein [Undibacterium fentianense]|uniref:DUF3016 domain-containing protein n=1 Tax=Undibacterium fentianense TaxID=2828728 RepID=A0A941IC90_9BURK|nr:DUF3016 domain-containing protein [Undibacterium fentianense]MBR7799939.1 DUF3016 domain-containing protein [Undibacterium fentianense]